MSQPNERHYLIEFYALGNSVKATAIDPETGVEATILGAAHTSREYLKSQAVKKLERKLKRLAASGGEETLF